MNYFTLIRMKNFSKFIVILALVSTAFTSCGDGCSKCEYDSSAAKCTESHGKKLNSDGTLAELANDDKCVAWTKAASNTCTACRLSTINTGKSGCDALTDETTIENCHIYGTSGVCQYCKNGAILDGNKCIQPTTTLTIPNNCRAAKIEGSKAICLSCAKGYTNNNGECKENSEAPTGCVDSSDANKCTSCNYKDGFFGTDATADGSTCGVSKAEPAFEFLVSTKTTTTDAVFSSGSSTASTTSTSTSGTSTTSTSTSGTSTTSTNTSGSSSASNTSTNTSSGVYNQAIGLALTTLLSYLFF